MRTMGPVSVSAVALVGVSMFGPLVRTARRGVKRATRSGSARQPPR
jgi:hypothetical protein